MSRLAVSTAAAFVALVSCSTSSPPTPLDTIVATGADAVHTKARPTYGTLAVRVVGDRLHRLQAARSETGTFRRRFAVTAASDAPADEPPIWSYPADETAPSDEFIDDFTVHPSGDVTITLDHRGVADDAFEILRFSSEGELLARHALPAGALVPESDLGNLPRPPFRMASTWNDDALAEGWIRVVASGDDVVVAFLTSVGAPDGGFSLDVASAVMWLRWDGDRYTEVWTRVVDGRHAVGPAAWAYDELRWRQAAVRPYLAIDPDTDRIVVGRAWNNRRCEVTVETFGEFTQTDCVFGSVSPIENERVPFAWTTFAADGTREGTRSFIAASSREFVIFDMASRNGLVALVGSRVHEDAEGNVAYYDGNLVPYDGYVALLDRASGELRLDRNIDGSGRGDVLSALRFVDEGVLAAGATDWDRWNGGMSISRGADPFLVFVSLEGDVVTRSFPIDAPARHTHLLGIDVREDRPRSIVGAGLSDAPMTHSGDGGQVEQMVFGDAIVTLTVAPD